MWHRYSDDLPTYLDGANIEIAPRRRAVTVNITVMTGWVGNCENRPLMENNN